MKYWELIKVSGKTSTLTSTPNDVTNNEKENNREADKLITDFITESRKRDSEINDSISDIRAFLEELKTKNCEPPKGFEDTALNNDEITDVLNMFCEFYDRYFTDTPLADELSRIFVYNIPKPVYKAARYMHDHMEPDCLNPIYWFICMNLADPVYMMPHFITEAVNAISEKDFDRIDALNTKYCEENGIPFASSEDLSDYEAVDPDTIDPIVNDEIIKTSTDDSATSIDSFDTEVNVEEPSNINDEENDYETGNPTENE